MAPVEWDLLLESPLFWGAVMTLVGVLAGHWMARGSKREENELAGLRASVEVLRAEYARLNDEVKELRAEMEGTRKKYRVVKEKYSAAIVYIVSLHTLWRGLTVRLDRDGVPHAEIPDVPDLISEDITGIEYMPDTNSARKDCNE